MKEFFTINEISEPLGGLEAHKFVDGLISAYVMKPDDKIGNKNAFNRKSRYQIEFLWKYQQLFGRRSDTLWPISKLFGDWLGSNIQGMDMCRDRRSCLFEIQFHDTPPRENRIRLITSGQDYSVESDCLFIHVALGGW